MRISCETTIYGFSERYPKQLPKEQIADDSPQPTSCDDSRLTVGWTSRASRLKPPAFKTFWAWSLGRACARSLRVRRAFVAQRQRWDPGSQLPSALCSTLFLEGVPFQVNQPNKDALFFPWKSTGHLRAGCALPCGSLRETIWAWAKNESTRGPQVFVFVSKASMLGTYV